MTDRIHRKQGSAMVESCIVIALLCLVLFMLLQVSFVVSSRNVINYASIAAARAAAVGLDEEMVKTVIHYATIPTAGPMIHPDPREFKTHRPEGDTVGTQWDNALSAESNPRSERAEYEVAMREEFHRRDHPLAVLSYANWMPEGEAEVVSDFDESDYDQEILTITVSQRLPLTMPFSRLFVNPKKPQWVKVVRDNKLIKVPSKEISATSYMENHAMFYLKDVH